MRYAQIRSMDISNGSGIGVSIFVQGCPFHCKGCFNSETWDFNSGKKWNKNIKDKFLKLLDKPFIKRVSILGGEPLCEENAEDILDLINSISNDKKIWIYTGYTFESLLNNTDSPWGKNISNILKRIDVLVDGQFVSDLKDPNLKFCGSSNQRIIDVKNTLNKNEIVKLEV